MTAWQEQRIQPCNVCGVRMYHPKGERVSCVVCEALKARWKVIDAQVLTNDLTRLLDSASSARSGPGRESPADGGVGVESDNSCPQAVDK